LRRTLLDALNDGVMIAPGYFEPLGQLLHRLDALWTPNQKACRRGTETTYHPEKALHRYFVSVSVATFDWMQQSLIEAIFRTTLSIRCHNSDVTATLSSMDSVRFGRALGVGARAAAKTLVSAVDAANAPNPSVQRTKAVPSDAPPQGPVRVEQRAETPTARVGQQAARTATQARQTGQGLVRGSKRFGEAVWKPFVKLSGVLWLELAGVFFGLFAFFGAGWAWKLRGDLHETATNHDAHNHFLICIAMTIVFGYFLVSSFVKASRRGRGR
jgi:hypothetical protein